MVKVVQAESQSVDMNSIKAAKAALRKEVKAKLNCLTYEDKVNQSQEVTVKLFSNILYQTSKRLSIFLSMQDEIQTDAILKHSLQSGKLCYIPRYDYKSNFMDMVRLHSWEEYECLPETKWKIKQPPLDQVCEDALSTGGLDLIIVPGLAFTADGQRLGRGKGYYDTFLQRCHTSQVKPPATIALAFKEQICGHIPTIESDVSVDIVLTANS